MEHSPWHAGEKQLQGHLGVIEQMEAYGRRAIRSEMPDQHRQFYQQLPFMLYGAVDADGNPWASILERPWASLILPHLRCCCWIVCRLPMILLSCIPGQPSACWVSSCTPGGATESMAGLGS